MITVNDFKNKDNFFLMAGPCVIEGEDMALRIAEKVIGITEKLNMARKLKITENEKYTL